MPQNIRPGDVLADRYRLIDLLSEAGEGRFFRAHDKILDRHVALHIIAADDPRAPELTEAARVSATVSDPHLLRVLDIENRDDRCFVVNEWGSGTSLDILVAGEGPLRPRRAAWIVAEVADCLSKAHPQRIAHGRLVPEHVLLDTAGAVRLIGFCVDAALAGIPAGQVSQDVTDLGGLLYFLLTGKWAGESESSCASAPRAAGRVLRPRQVRAGIPRDLDRLCDQVLNPYSAGPGDSEHNLHTAAGIAAALREYVGDPSGLAEPAPVGGVHGAGALAVPMSHTAPPAAEATQVLDPSAAAPGADEPELPRTAAPASTSTGREPTQERPATAEPEPVDQPTQAGVPIFKDDDDVSWLERRSDPPPPPKFEALPERPLFAPDPPAGEPARRPRPGTPPGPGQSGYWPWENTGGVSSSSSGVIPVYEEPETEGGRHWLRIAGLIATALVLLVAMVIAYNLGRGKTALGGDPAPTTSSSSPSSSASTPTPITGIRANTLDPQQEAGGTENPELAPLAVDGDPSTDWHTLTYTQQFGPAGLKTGLGLVLDLGSQHDVSGLRLTMVGKPTEVRVYASDSPVDSVAGLTPVDEFTAQSKATRTFDSPTQARYVVLWFTSLPQVSGGFAGGVAEAVVLE